ncbi:ATPase [Aureococcus anophagefferens]|nr:ATPase [Aureococcus anophagefferens]
MGRVVDAYAKGQRRGAGLRVELRRTACVFAVGALASGVRVSCFSRALQKALRRLRGRLRRALGEGAFFVLGEQSGDDRLDADAVATAVERDASVALAVCTEQLQNAFRYASSLFNGGSQLFALCPGLAGELLTCVPVLAVLVRGASKSVAKRGAGAEHAEKAPAVKARDLARSDARTRSSSRAATPSRRRASRSSPTRRYTPASPTASRGERSRASSASSANLPSSASSSRGHRVERGDLSGGDLLAFALYAGYASLGLAGLAKFAASELKAGTSRGVPPVLARGRRRGVGGAAGRRGGRGGAGVTPDHLVLDDVTFGCADRAAGAQNCSLQRGSGTSHALVGASGAGKSSILRLLLRLYDADAGVVRVDGADVAKMAPGDLAGLRKARAAVVEQASLLLSSGSRVVDAVRTAGARRRRTSRRGGGRGRRRLHPRARRGLPRGDRRHGRPPQRRPAEPAVGRAAAAPATFWLLDEPTAALDAKTEAAVLDNVLGLAKARGVTVLLVAHSKAAVAKCDFASVLAGGAVVETGTVAVLAQDPKSKLAAALAAE